MADSITQQENVEETNEIDGTDNTQHQEDLKSLLENEKKKNFLLKEKINDIISSKNKKIQTLQEMIKSLAAQYNFEVPEMEEEKDEINIDDFQVKTIKDIFTRIKEVFYEFHEEVERLEEDKDVIFHNKFVDFTVKETESSSVKILNEIVSILKGRPQTEINEDLETQLMNSKQEIDKLNAQVTELQLSSVSKEEKYSVLENHCNELKKQIEDSEKLSQEKNTLIDSQKELLEALKEKLEKKENTVDDLELKLNRAIIDYRVKDDEVGLLLSIIYTVIKRDKEKYEMSFKKLSADSRAQVDSYVKEGRIFK